jgi:hypothetical protein
MTNRNTDTVTLVESVDQARKRLAAKARKGGVKITFADDGRWFASSVSKPGTRHFVTAYSCDCVGFFNHGRCKHNAALLSMLGWLDLDDPELEPTPAATVPSIHDMRTGAAIPRNARDQERLQWSYYS